ncbi:hypothetical protein [Pseudonocardia sp. ICBG601]|uniref:hypothetical protein n=1 Tax=Pseudonocardia sp. ICBG601 TaxID=2846759 RepID=UPI001CF61C7D|nr:hypothetical protein [Pseudonocardia sp. ICBG601]
MTRAKAGRRRQRGTIDRLPSGALRVRVYGGQDPVSGKRNTLVEVIEPGPRQEARAEAAWTRLLDAVDEQRSPRTSATLDQLLDRYLETLDVDATTLRAYTRCLSTTAATATATRPALPMCWPGIWAACRPARTRWAAPVGGVRRSSEGTRSTRRRPTSRTSTPAWVRGC